jgi:hypothetical protein
MGTADIARKPYWSSSIDVTEQSDWSETAALMDAIVPDGQIDSVEPRFRCRVIFLSRSEIVLFIPSGKSKL